MLAAHVTQQPEPITSRRPAISPALGAIVMRCLAKRPADRWQSADEILTRLNGVAALVDVIDSGEIPPPTAAGTRRRTRGWAVARGVTARRWAIGALAIAALAAFAWTVRPRALASPTPAIAVLLFQSGSPDLEPLALGLTSDLIGALGSVPQLDVRSMDAVWPYRGGLTPLNVVGRRLDVQWIVGGNVLRLGDSVTGVGLSDRRRDRPANGAAAGEHAPGRGAASPRRARDDRGHDAARAHGPAGAARRDGKRALGANVRSPR